MSAKCATIILISLFMPLMIFFVRVVEGCSNYNGPKLFKRNSDYINSAMGEVSKAGCLFDNKEVLLYT